MSFVCAECLDRFREQAEFKTHLKAWEYIGCEYCSDEADYKVHWQDAAPISYEGWN